MLKRLAILAMVLTIAHAPKPTSGQAVDKPTANAQKQNQGIDKEENPSEAAAPVMPKNNSDGTNQREPEKSRDANQNSSINVTNPAPVPKVWHWYEIVAWAANIILVIVGLFGIFAA